MGSILRTQPRRLFADFLAIAVDAGANAATVQRAAEESIRWLKGGDPIRGGLLDRWYDGLAAGRRDFEVYAADDYLGDLWAGWAYYCRKYLLALDVKVFPNYCPSRVADVGCGFGFSTLALAELFPSARVYGTNLRGQRRGGSPMFMIVGRSK